jgi:hypothetical protein
LDQRVALNVDGVTRHGKWLWNSLQLLILRRVLYVGKIKYVGTMEGKACHAIWCGVQLDDPGHLLYSNPMYWYSHSMQLYSGHS